MKILNNIINKFKTMNDELMEDKTGKELGPIEVEDNSLGTKFPIHGVDDGELIGHSIVDQNGNASETLYDEALYYRYAEVDGVLGYYRNQPEENEEEISSDKVFTGGTVEVSSTKGMAKFDAQGDRMVFRIGEHEYHIEEVLSPTEMEVTLIQD